MDSERDREKSMMSSSKTPKKKGKGKNAKDIINENDQEERFKRNLFNWKIVVNS